MDVYHLKGIFNSLNKNLQPGLIMVYLCTGVKQHLHGMGNCMLKKGKNNQTFRAAGQLRMFMLLPVFLGIMLAAATIGLYFINTRAAYIMTVISVIYICVCGWMLAYARSGILYDIGELTSNYANVKQRLLYELTLPYCLVDNSGRVVWMNRAMQEITEKKKDFHRNISNIFPEITSDVFPAEPQKKEYTGR